jgi:S-DNA-T family DNA segregation ATPase FtsK/SpoIIIE
VLNGPDAGREFALRPGANVIGRDPSAEVILSDSLVSRRHARIEVGRSVELIDLNSANGIEVDGGLVTRATLSPGSVATIGDSTIVVDLLRTTVAVPVPSTGAVHGGSRPFNRSPLVEPRYPLTEHPRPQVPSEIDKPPFPWLMMIAPVLIGAIVFAVTRNPLSLIFVAMSPLMLISNYMMTRLRASKRLGAQTDRFEKQLTALDELLTSEAPRERQVRNDEAPTTIRTLDAATQLGPLLWTRRPEHWNFLSLRLGTGRATSRNTVTAGAGLADGLPELDAALLRVIERHRYIDGVPIVESLATAGALGVAGPADAAMPTTQALLTQIVCLHSPAEVVIAALGGPQTAHDFEWLKWTPHTSSPQSPISGSHLAIGPATAGALLSQLEELIDLRLGAAGGRPRGPLATELEATTRGGGVGLDEAPAPLGALPAVVLLIGSDAPVNRGRAIQLAERCTDAGIYTIWVDSEPAHLPAVCRTFVDVTGPVASVGFVRHGLVIRDVEVEVTRRDTTAVLGKHLAALTDASAVAADQSDLPRSISMLSLLGRQVATDPDSVVDRWRQNLSVHDRSGNAKPSRRAGSLRALVGQRGADSMHLDLRAQGPHALVGGTTGSGKSEFLQSWVLGMAAEYSPDRVTFLFVDYKGGAAFAECVNLPHCVGLVTDLSPHLVRRALTSLKAELRRREDILNHKQAKDILELEKLSDPECPPALVLVIDEFAALVGEVPEFVDGVVDVAQRGRSLGINLIMATQRPAGVIKDNLRANTNLRIALRMADESDSSDVVGTPVAAGFDPAIPGRAIAKTGPGRLIPFQSGYTGGWTTDEPPAPSVLIRDLLFGAGAEWEKPAQAEVMTDPGPKDLTRAVSTISIAAVAADIRPPRRPWLNELHRVYDLAGLAPRTDSALILGLVDQPESQAQSAVFFNPDIDGNLAIYGTGGSGKSVLLRTLAVGAGITPRGGPVHVYGLDFAAGGLRMLETLPHVGSIISGDDAERVGRLLRHVRSVADERARTFPSVNAANIAEYRTLAARPNEPRILLLIDGFPSFRTEYEGVGTRAQAYAILQQLISEGRQLGIHVAFTADRPAGVPGAIASSVPRRVVLRMAEDTMYIVLDVPNDVLGPTSPPGRAIIDGLEAQIAVLGGSANAADQFDALVRLSRSISGRNHVLAPEIRSMPTEINLSELPASVDGLPVLGISETELLPIGFSAEGTFLLGGGPSSGRSNALASILASIERAEPGRPRYYLGHRRSDLPSRGTWTECATTPEAVADLAKRLVDELQSDLAAPTVVVVESLADFHGTPADAAIVSLAKLVKRSGHFLLAEAETPSWNSSFPLFVEIKSARRGILLQPETPEGDLILKTSFPRVSRAEFPPGRGMYVSGGRALRVQLPMADSALSNETAGGGAVG